jgi:inosose dehydratase
MPSIVGTQAYCWFQIYQEQGQKYEERLDEVFASVAAAGIQAWEGGCSSQADADRQKELLKKHGLVSRSMYVGGDLHTADWPKAIEAMLAQARWGQSLGVQVVVSNPSPLAWNQPRNKSDDQLKTQAEALDTLGKKLRADGLQLAYHTHDPEMRAAAREFHHMLLATDPQNVGLCLDAHWVYRGAENSQVALFDIVKLYGPRLRSVHLRQSQQGVWTETFGNGDIDYRQLAQALADLKFAGPLILEQCVEKGTPRTLPGEERQRRGRAYIREVFGV